MTVLNLEPETLLRTLFAMGYLGLATVLWLRASPWWSAIIAVIGSGWLLYSRSILKWVAYLGSDSFSEAQDFDLAEALTFLETIGQVVQRDSFRATGSTILAGLVLLLVALFVARRRDGERFGPASTPVLMGALALMAGPFLVQVYPAFGAFRWNSQYYEGIYENFHGHSDVRLSSKTPLTELSVIVHIGESTTSMNMGIYGYFRPTTPELESFAAGNENLLVFRDVLSTHTHTAPSLLEALSIGADPGQDFLPISERRRTSIIDLLRQAGIATALISNQGQSGSWNNLASTVVFRHVDEREFSFNSAWMGEMEHFASRPLDHEFFLPALERSGHLDQPGPRVVFLHSYAGHSPYWKNIAPAFREPVDQLTQRTRATAIVGKGIANQEKTTRWLDEYDSVIRYVDHMVASLVRRVAASPHPAVYIYLSDHGEAVYAGLGHDSSRFLHEMARVPLLVYFNDAAAHSYPGIVDEFRAAANAQNVSTLAQFPATLLSLFGLAVDGDGLKGIGREALDRLPPILTRETAAGFQYIRLGSRSQDPEEARGFIQLHDPHTAVFRASRMLRNRAPALCVQRAHTVGKAARGAISADCLHAEVSIRADGTPWIVSAPDPTAALSPDLLLSITSSYNRYLFLFINNNSGLEGCSGLLDALSGSQRRDPPEALVMFPAGSLDDELIGSCIRPLQALGYDTGIMLPDDFVAACLQSSGNGDLTGSNCQQLRAFLTQAEQSGAFSDLGIRADAAALVELLGREVGLGWNALEFPVAALEALGDTPFRRVVVNLSDDPNS